MCRRDSDGEMLIIGFERMVVYLEEFPIMFTILFSADLQFSTSSHPGSLTCTNGSDCPLGESDSHAGGADAKPALKVLGVDISEFRANRDDRLADLTATTP